MELSLFKETLLEFLSDVTRIPEKGKNWFLDKEDAKEPFNAPHGYKVLSPYVLVKIQTASKVPDRPKPTPEEGQEVTEEEEKEEIYYCYVHFRIYTEAHCFGIGAVWKDFHPTYLGCIATTRKFRVGEDWNRGNDLPDGYFCRETWEKIKNAILRYEMKALSDYIVNGRWTGPYADKE
jgi:hypothetical protein